MSRRLRTLILAGAATLLVGLNGALAQGGWREVYRESFPEDAHPLYLFGGVLQYGPRQDTPFVTLARGGRLELINETDPGFIRYYFVEPRHVGGAWLQTPDAPPRVSVTVSGEFGEVPSAGIVYRVDPATHDFYAFVLTGGNGYGLYVLDSGGYRALFTETSAAIVPGAPTLMSIEGDAQELRFYLNGTLAARHAAGGGGVGVGILAAGTGNYLFDDFIIELGGP